MENVTNEIDEEKESILRAKRLYAAAWRKNPENIKKCKTYQDRYWRKRALEQQA